MNYLLTTEGLDFSYNGKKKVIENLDLKVPEKSIYGFLGSNGSGKTTTIKLLLGLLKPSKGRINLENLTFNSSRIKYLSKIGALVESPALYTHLTARENLIIGARYRNIAPAKRISEVLEIVKLQEVGDKTVSTFSSGMKQRLAIALAILSNPEFLILDEPTNGLDPQGIQEVRELIVGLNRSEGTTIFISSHLLNEIEKISTHVGIIKDGKLIFQEKTSVLKSNSSQSITLEIEMDLLGRDDILKQPETEFHLKNPNLFEVKLKSKEDIPDFLKNLTRHNVKVYQLRIKNDLEDLFLKMTQR